VRDHRIVVRRAKHPKKIRTLDASTTLDTGICMSAMVTVPRRCIGGIMGGAETDISFSTKNVLIECACSTPLRFDAPRGILKLHTEASTRFGAAPIPKWPELASALARRANPAARRGDLLAGLSTSIRQARAQEILSLAPASPRLGADTPDKQIESSLRALGFRSRAHPIKSRRREGSLLAAWNATALWRAEVEREIDLHPKKSPASTALTNFPRACPLPPGRRASPAFDARSAPPRKPHWPPATAKSSPFLTLQKIATRSSVL